MKYLAIFRTQLQNRMTYAGDLAAQSISIVLFLWIFFQLWRTTFHSSGATEINGLSLNDTLWYLMIAETIILSKPRISRRISEDVKDGSIAYLLNKPYNFLLYQLSVGLGDGITAMVFNLILGGLTVWLLAGPPPPVSGWFFTLIAIILSWLIDFCFNAMIGLAAFVAEEVNAFEWIYQKTVFLLGGLLIPLDFFPTWIQKIAFSLPFAYILYGPARFFVDPTIERFASLVSIQLVWLLLSGTALTFIFQRGIRRLAINGG